MSVSTHFFSYGGAAFGGGGPPVGDFLIDDYSSEVLTDIDGTELENA